MDWNGAFRIASRSGTSFLLTTPNSLVGGSSERVSELAYKDCGGVKRGAAIKFQQLTANFKELVRVGCSSAQNPYVIGSVLERSQPAANMTVTANGAGNATANGITISNLAVNSNYEIVANINRVNNNVSVPSTANFTIIVNNGVTQTQPTTLNVKLSTVTDDFTARDYLPDSAVNQAYSVRLTDPAVPATACGSLFNLSVTGELPPGTAVILKSPNINQYYALEGTPRSGGKYVFTVTKNYENGETLSRTFHVLIKSDIAELPGNLVSWWRAEKDSEDFTGANKGTQVGTVGYTDGKVNSGWRFNGSNSYIALPNKTFNQPADYSFELWFKTGTKGVIIGRQSADKNPYDTQLYGASPMIYVHQNGKLYVNMFVNGNTTVSPTRVDDNNFHHVAVVFNRNGNVRTTYLDGTAIGTINGDVRSFSNYDKFQFGTGYVYEGTTGGMNGWFNFNGVIDEATLYSRALTQSEIQKIYAAGFAGKMSVETFAAPPHQRDGNDGAIIITAQGGTPALQYSINNGATFKDTSFFPNLTPGTYTVVVKDGANRRVTRTVIVANPPPSLSLTTELVHPQCPNAATGEIRIIATGTTSSNIEYSIRNGSNIQTSPIFSGYGPGTYTPWIRDVASNTTYAGSPVTLVAPATVAISPNNFVNGAVGVPYSRTFAFSGGTAPFIISAQGEDASNGYALPAGLSANADGSSITISGTPTQAGNYSIFFRTDDANNCYAGFRVPFVITANATYGIAGKVTNGGQGLANVTVTLAGGENRTTTTDASGNYSFSTVAGAANYTVTASLNGMTFAQPTLTFNNLSQNITNADFATAATTFEGDIAPRPTGDGNVNVLDLVALGRILMPNNPDSMPASGAEFQRADTDPRASLGNGAINQNDLTQLRNYILAVNPKTPAGGAVGAASANFTASFENTEKANGFEIDSDFAGANSAVDSATVSADTVTYQGGSVQVPIRLASNGSVAATQFTVSYNAAKLIFVNATSAAGAAPNTLVYAGANNLGDGKLKFIVQQPIDNASAFPAGTVPLMTLNFTLAQNAAGFARIDFADDPVARLASDVQANLIALGSTAGGVSITPVYSISGKVTNGGQGLANVTVQRRQQGVPGSVSTTTDAAGNYSLGDLTLNQTYTVTPLLNGYTFNPNQQQYFLNGNVANADFATTTATYEGDIANRPNGDGAVDVLDLVAVGRIISGLDALPTLGGEWQRTDVAPRNNLGDGAVDVLDLVQIGLYAGSLSPRTPAGGAISAAPPSSAASFAEQSESTNTSNSSFPGNLFDGGKQSWLSKLIADPLAMPPGTATVSADSAAATSTNAVVPIRLSSSGDVQAIQFTVNYDPAKLSIPDLNAIQNRYPNTTFVLNNNTPGKLGVVAFQPLDGVSTFPTGSIQLFTINFTLVNNPGGTTVISFGDDPTPRRGSTPQATSVTVLDAPGTVTFLGPTSASVTVSGRVLTPTGRGLTNAIVTMTDSRGEVRSARTSSFGYFRFDEIAAGQTYVFNVISKRYSFAPQVITVNEAVSELNFTAQ